MANYHQVKNAAILTPTGSTDLGSDANRYSNVFMSGNIVLNNSVVVTSNNAVPPRITSITYLGNDTAADIAGGQTITITGTNFNNAGGVPTVIIGTTVAPAVSYISSTSLTFTTPALSAGTYLLTILHSDGAAAIFASGISYSGTPSWTNAAGSLGTVYETANISTTLTASGDAPITYSVVSGTLPTGSTLDSSTGLISGTTSSTDNSTTYNFTIKATDAQNQDTNRAFSLTISPDIITWNSPADGTSTALGTNNAMTNFTMSATSAAGKSITYTANSLPTGLSITGANIVGTPTVVANTSTLITATASTTNRTATRTFNWVVSVANDTYFSYTTLLLNGETTVTPFNSDASTNSFGLTINGDTKPNNFNPYTLGYYSNYFDGTGDYLSIPSNSAFQFGTGDFTIECWFYDTGTSDTYPGIISSINGWQSGSTALRFNNTGNRKFGFFHNPTGDPIFSSTNTFSSYQWYHVAVTRSGTSMKMFVNGVQEASATVSASISLDTTTGVFIGSGFDASSKIKGYISNVRVVKGTAVYTAAFTPSTTPLTAISGTSLLTCQSNRFIDNSTNNFTITKAGDTAVSSVIPFTANSSYSTYGSTYFDGTGDYLTTPASSILDVGNTSWTIECWVYMNNTTGTQMIVGYNNTSASDFWDLTVVSGVPTFKRRIVSSEVVVSGGTVSANIFTHVAVVRNGTAVTIYLNGSSVATNASVSMPTSMSDQILGIGANRYGNGYEYYFNGFISNLRIVKGTAVYTTTFTPSTTPLTAITNTSLLTLQYNGGATNQAIIDNSNFNNIITRVGNTSQGSFSPYSVTGWSNYFDGTGDYLSIPYSSAFNLTGDFTIEFWVNFGNLPTSTGVAPQSYQRLFSFGTYNAANSLGLEVNSNDNGQIRRWATWYNGSGASLSTNNAVDTNIWYHVAMVRSGTTITLYVNGTSTGLTVTGASAAVNTSQAFYIGSLQGFESDTSACFKGYISNFRILKGTALYTTTFTPPTSPLTPITNTQLLTCQSNRLIDNSPNTFTLTKAGDVSVQALNPFGSVPEAVPISYSNFFDGTGDYLTIPSDAAFAFGTGDFCLEFWIYTTAFGSTDSRPLGNNTSWAANAWSLHSDHGTANEKYTFWVNNYNSGSAMFTSTSSVILNTWTHVAITRSGTSWRMFINGVQEGSTVTSSAALDGGSSDDMYIGGSGAANEYVTGYMSNVRVVKGTAVYTSAFTPSTTPLTSIANTSLLTCQSTTMIDNSTNAFTITAAGNTIPRIFNPFGYTAQSATSYTPSLHGGSAYFGGSTSTWVAVPINATFAFGTNNYTYEAWVYPTALPNAYNTVFCNFRDDEGNKGWSLLITSGGLIHVNNQGTYNNSTNAISLNTWTHLAVCRVGNTVTRYINGVADPTTLTVTASITNVAAQGITLGGSPEHPSARAWSGYISSARVISGTALYTSNFVPPTQTLTAITNTSLLLNFNNGGIIDQHGTNVLETVGNAQLSTAVKKYNNASMYFDGTGDYLSIPASNSFSTGTGNFTIEGWIYVTDLSAIRCICGTRTIADTTTGWNLGILTTGSMQIYDNTGYAATGTGSVVVNTWCHFAFVRQSNVFYSYINGIQKASTACSRDWTQNTFWVGHNGGQTEPFIGYIDDLRLTKGYARYTATFTPPTSALITK